MSCGNRELAFLPARAGSLVHPADGDGAKTEDDHEMNRRDFIRGSCFAGVEQGLGLQDEIGDFAHRAVAAGPGGHPVAMLLDESVCVLHRDGQSDPTHDRQIGQVVADVGRLCGFETGCPATAL